MTSEWQARGDELSRLADTDAERRQLRELWHRLGDVDVGSPNQRLESGFITGLRLAHEVATLTTRRWWQRPAAAAALLAAAVALGGIGGQGLRLVGSAEPAGLRQEVAAWRRAALLSLPHRATAAGRLALVDQLARHVTRDAGARSTLVELMRLDPSVNVRLAAVDALRPVAASSSVAADLAIELGQAESPMVSLALIDLAVDGSVKAALPALEALAQDESVPDLVREEAVRATRLLHRRRSS